MNCIIRRHRSSSLPTSTYVPVNNKQNSRKSDGNSKYFPHNESNGSLASTSDIWTRTSSGTGTMSAPNTPSCIRVNPSSVAKTLSTPCSPSNKRTISFASNGEGLIKKSKLPIPSPREIFISMEECKNKLSSTKDIALLSAGKITIQINTKAIHEVAHKIDNEELLRVYGSGPNNWGDLPYFRGDYINFGYWKDLDINVSITEETRIQSSLALYQVIINSLKIENNHKILEVGCGRGVGITEVLARKPHGKIKALDMNEEQLRKTKDNIDRYNITNKGIIKQELNVKYIEAYADKTGLKSESIDRIYSVEAAQHFDSMASFLQEMRRILKPGGILVFTTFFLKKPMDFDELKMHLPHVEDKIDKLHFIDTVIDDCQNAGFLNVEYKSIGANVFPGYDKFLEQNNSNEWSRCFNPAFSNGIIDYNILICM